MEEYTIDMHRHSPIVPIIFGTFIILVIIGVAILATTNKNVLLVGNNTATTTPSDSTATSTPAGTASSTEATSTSATHPTWLTKTNSTLGFRMQYPPAMSVKDNQEYPPVPGEGITATVFTFPASQYAGGTTKDANVSVTKTQTVCTTWADGSNVVDVTATKTINGNVFEYRVLKDAGAGNFYSTFEYSTRQNNQCVRIALFTHVTSPSAEFPDLQTADAKTQKNNDIEKALLKTFEDMVSTFVLTK